MAQKIAPERRTHKAQVFVYGTLRKDMGNHGLLINAQHVADLELTAPLQMYSLGGFPAVRKYDAPMSITGEVYAVSEEELERLDQLEGHPDWYKREVYDSEVGPVWVYVMPKELIEKYAPIIQCNDWVEYTSQQQQRFFDDDIPF